MSERPGLQSRWVSSACISHLSYRSKYEPEPDSDESDESVDKAEIDSDEDDEERPRKRRRLDEDVEDKVSPAVFDPSKSLTDL